jgi:hypothetical protein
MKITIEGANSWLCIRLILMSLAIIMGTLGYCLFGKFENSALAGLLVSYIVSFKDDIIYLAISFCALHLKMVSVERLVNFSKLTPEISYKSYLDNWK